MNQPVYPPLFALMGSAGGGSGDVAGPASVTDNEIARFNGTTGKLLQNSSVILDDSQRIFGASGGGVALDTAGTVKIASSSGAPTQNGALTSATFRVYAQGDTARETSLFVLSTAPYLGLYDSTAPNIRFSRSGNAENSHNAIISNSIAAVVDFDSSAVANGLGSARALYWATRVGAAVASASTITPTAGIFHVTGTSTIDTINLPWTGFTGSLTMIADDVFALTTGGNIATAATATAGRTLTVTYDGTSWYPE